jgi:hypothetical protein
MDASSNPAIHEGNGRGASRGRRAQAVSEIWGLVRADGGASKKIYATEA